MLQFIPLILKAAGTLAGTAGAAGAAGAAGTAATLGKLTALASKAAAAKSAYDQLNPPIQVAPPQSTLRFGSGQQPRRTLQDLLDRGI